tara:strand:+ start:17941 stop:19275 length:1335 start_codon:yes stop_codon:yes gene_type:complete
MKNLKTTIIIALSLILLPIGNCLAQKEDASLTQKQASVTIDSIGNKLKANYIFPEVADKMIVALESNFKKGNYKSITDPQEFASQLTEDLQSISHDKHLRVNYDPEGIAEREKVVTAADSIKYLNDYISSMQRSNFGFNKVEILDGNIGYLDLRNFSDTEYAGETAVAAMNFLSNTDAIIIDLRQNGGGSPAMIQLITSYLYGAELVHLNNFYWRPTDSHTQTWTLPHVSGKRNPDADVYVLTSNRTFSAAEEFSYNLKNLERATLIGETTGGGAHPGGTRKATDKFTIWLPTGRAINPITNTNWEGVGVVPHIAVKADEALEVAKIKALETLIAKTKDEEMLEYYDWSLQGLKVLKNPVFLDESILKSYIGSFGPRMITFENGKLYYQRESGTKYELKAINQNEFMLVGLSYFRIRFLKENNKVIALQGRYEGGRTDKNLKSD